MEKRLKLAKNLLKDSGILVVSIDDNEVAQIKMLLDDTNFFGEKNFIAILPTIMNLKGNQDQFGFAGTHEYTIVYAKDISKAKIGHFIVDDDGLEKWEEDEYGFFKKGANLKATGVNAPRQKRPNLFFPIFITKDNQCYVTNDDKARNKNDIEILPITDGQEMSWRWSKDKIQKEKHNIIIENGGKTPTIYKKQRPMIGDLPSSKPKTIFYKPEYSSGNGTAQLKSLFGDKVFNNPKPLDLIKDLIRITSPKNGICLDFMAGSGTTGHAILDLNKEDGGNRKFILCTNNENKIVTDICQPRLEKVIKGYKNNKGEKE
jgi:adenine-specific DNA-methyltransferase